jgi:hypothetical protein
MKAGENVAMPYQVYFLQRLYILYLLGLSGVSA